MTDTTKESVQELRSEVKELCTALSDKLSRPFEHADMNRKDIDWQGAYDAMRAEINEDDYPMAIIEFLDAVAKSG
jgi:hypothetical protein